MTLDHDTRLFGHTTNWIVNYPLVTGILILAISGLATLGYLAPQTVLSLFSSVPVPADEPAMLSEENLDRPPDVDPFSLTNADAVIVVESEQFFTPAGARTLRHVVEQIEALDYVTGVVWMDRVPMLNIFGLREPLLPSARASQRRFDAAREKALQHPLVKGQLLSADARTLLLMVNFDYFYVEQNSDCVDGLRVTAEKAAAEVSDVKIAFSVTGPIPLYLAAMEQHEENVRKYQLIGYGMIALMSLILFRGLAAVIIVAVAPVLGVFWTIGLLPYFELQHNPFNDVILPVLISLVGFADGVHLMVHIRRLRADGLDHRAAARQGLQEVGLACGLTSLTTAIGFGSLTLASHEIVREFGWCCVLGVALTFVAVITTIPLLCSSWLGRGVHRGLEKSLIDQNLQRIGGSIDYVLRNARTFSWVAIVVTGSLALLSLALRPDERRVEGLPGRAEPVIALQKMDQALGGLEFGEIQLYWKKEIESGAGEILEVLTAVDDVLAREALLGHPLSICSLLDALPGDGPAADRMSLLDLLPPPLKRAFYTPESRQAKAIFRVQDLGIATYGPVFLRIQQALQEIERQHPAFTLALQGNAVWRWENLYRIVVDLVKSLASASLVIFVVLAIVYRSIRIGLISIIPNLFPLVLSASFLVLTGQHLEMVTVCAFTVCLGIAVDDTIHFLTRYREERRKSDDQQAAIRRAFTGVGTALIMTTVVLLAGFATVLTSDSREHRIFAWMGGITIASALFGDLFFLPALLARFDAEPRRPSEQRSSPREPHHSA